MSVSVSIITIDVTIDITFDCITLGIPQAKITFSKIIDPISETGTFTISPNGNITLKGDIIDKLDSVGIIIDDCTYNPTENNIFLKISGKVDGHTIPTSHTTLNYIGLNDCAQYKSLSNCNVASVKPCCAWQRGNISGIPISDSDEVYGIWNNYWIGVFVSTLSYDKVGITTTNPWTNKDTISFIINPIDTHTKKPVEYLPDIIFKNKYNNRRWQIGKSDDLEYSANKIADIQRWSISSPPPYLYGKPLTLINIGQPKYCNWSVDGEYIQISDDTCSANQIILSPNFPVWVCNKGKCVQRTKDYWNPSNVSELVYAYKNEKDCMC